MEHGRRPYKYGPEDWVFWASARGRDWANVGEIARSNSIGRDYFLEDGFPTRQDAEEALRLALERDGYEYNGPRSKVSVTGQAIAREPGGVARAKA